MVLALFTASQRLALTGWLYTTDRFFGDETVEIVHETLAWTSSRSAHCTSAASSSRAGSQRENLVAAMFDGESARRATTTSRDRTLD